MYQVTMINRGTNEKIISIILFLVFQMISYSFEDNYIFNAERIKKYFLNGKLKERKMIKIIL